MQKSYKRENIIGFADVDYQERLRPFRVFELLEDISDAHANILEIGAQSPVMEGYVWVVARNRYRLTRMPRLGEKITFETWPGQCQRAIYPRLFSMTDESGCRPLASSSRRSFPVPAFAERLPHWRRSFYLDVAGCKKTKIGCESKNQCDVSEYRGLGCPGGNAAQAQAATAYTPACLLHTGLFRS